MPSHTNGRCCLSCRISLYLVPLLLTVTSLSAFATTWGTTQHVWDTGGYFSYTPAIGSDGTIYAGANDTVFYAFNANGTTQWIWNLSSPIEDSPAIHTNGNVYVGTEDGYLYALLPDGSTNLIWENPMGANIYGISIGPNGMLYIAPSGTNVYVLSADATTTQNIWTANSFLDKCPAVAGDGSVYCATVDDLLYQFKPDGTTGHIWHVATQNAKPVLGWNGSIYIGSTDTNLYEFKPDGTTGHIWQASGKITTSAAIDKYGNVYVADYNHRIYAFNYDGSTQAIWDISGFPSRSPLIADDGTVYIGSSDGILYGFSPDGSTGFAWHTTSALSAASPTMDTNGTLYIGSTDGNLFAFDSGGKQLQKSAWPSFRRDIRNTCAQPITHFVATNGADTAPYTSWTTAADTIQKAINVSLPGELVLVGNGVYQAGGARGPGMTLTNTVCITNGVVVSSQNGPAYTFISGKPHTTSAGPTAQRCVYVGSNTAIWGFSLTNGFSNSSGDVLRDQSSAGAFCETNNSLVVDCHIYTNYAVYYGGGIYQGEAHHCIINGNRAGYGGGAAYAEIVHCIVNSNFSYRGGGLNNGSASDSEIGYNDGGSHGGGLYRADAARCRIHHNIALAGDGQGGGTYEGTFTQCDIYENAAFEGGGTYQSDLDDCLIATNASGTAGGGCSGGDLTNCIVLGNHTVMYGGGGFNIAAVNCEIIDNVTSNNDGGGVHGTVVSAILSNCVVKYNRAGDDGGGASGYRLFNCDIYENYATNDNSCYGGGVYDCTVSGGTIQSNQAHSGGGAAESEIIDCYIYKNKANVVYTNGPQYGAGGGAYNCVLTRCTIYKNDAINDGGGGGMYGGQAYRCDLDDNLAEGRTVGELSGGGGAWRSYLENCNINDNFVNSMGGGLMSSTAKHCTVYDNYANLIGGGGLYQSVAENCIVYSNTVRTPGAIGRDHLESTLRYSCSSFTNAFADGNITNNPMIIDGYNKDFHISSNSPCIDAGTNLGVIVDRDGLPRPLDGNNDGIVLPDMGAYEILNPIADSDGDLMPDGWEIGYSLSPTNPADAGWDNDSDGPDNENEYIADTDPTDSNSYFYVVSMSNTSDRAVYYQSSSNRQYTLEYAPALNTGSWTNLAGQSNVPGSGGEDSLSDTNAATGMRVYRVKVGL